MKVARFVREQKSILITLSYTDYKKVSIRYTMQFGAIVPRLIKRILIDSESQTVHCLNQDRAPKKANDETNDKKRRRCGDH